MQIINEYVFNLKKQKYFFLFQKLFSNMSYFYIWRTMSAKQDDTTLGKSLEN